MGGVLGLKSGQQALNRSALFQSLAISVALQQSRRMKNLVLGDLGLRFGAEVGGAGDTLIVAARIGRHRTHARLSHEIVVEDKECHYSQ